MASHTVSSAGAYGILLFWIRLFLVEFEIVIFYIGKGIRVVMNVIVLSLSLVYTVLVFDYRQERIHEVWEVPVIIVYRALQFVDVELLACCQFDIV